MSASDNAFPMDAGDVYGCCWCAGGWESALEDSVQPAWDRSRGAAKARYARCEYLFTEVSAWRRHIRLLDRQEKYEHWVEGEDGGWYEHPAAVPDDWEHDKWDESLPHWAMCAPDDPRGTPAWICGPTSDGAPNQPARATAR